MSSRRSSNAARAASAAAVVISSGFGEEKSDEAAGARRRVARGRRALPAWSSAGPNSRRARQPAAAAGRDLQPGVPRPQPSRCCPKAARPSRSRSAARSGALTFSFLSRGRDRAAADSPTRSAPATRPCWKRTIMSIGCSTPAAPTSSCAISKASATRPLPRGRRQGRARRQAADRRQGRPLRRRAARRRLAYRGAGAVPARSTTRSSAITASSAARTSTTWSMSRPPSPLQAAASGNRVAIITGSGGSAVWMADILSAHGLELPVLEDDIQRRIMALLPSYASAQNPIDATAQAIGEVGYAPLVELVRAVAADRHDPADRLARQRDDRAKKRAEELAGDRRRRPSSRSCCRPIRPRRRARWPRSPRPASPATPRCRAAPARSARWSITAAFQERVARAGRAADDPAGGARRGRPRARASPARC